MNCSVKNCKKKSRSSGILFCEVHYYRIRRTGNPGSSIIQRREYHKRSRTIEYVAWAAMRSRCNNPKNVRFRYYGGRGIKVCRRWNKFTTFLDDMGKRPSIRHSIDRVNVNGNYSPANCKWSTIEEQVRNRTITKMDKRKISKLRSLKESGSSTKELMLMFGLSQTHVDKIVRKESWY